jgi:hypothetical protein
MVEAFVMLFDLWYRLHYIMRFGLLHNADKVIQVHCILRLNAA